MADRAAGRGRAEALFLLTPHHQMRGHGPVLLLAGSLLTGASACAHERTFYDRGLVLVSADRRIALGQEALPVFLASYGGETPSPELGRWVAALGARIAARSSRPELAWSFHVADSDAVDAFPLPGGQVLVTRGLLRVLSSEAELAGILGHQIAHVTAGHVGQQLTREIAVRLATTDTSEISGQPDERWLAALGVSDGEATYSLEFSREQELEADRLAVELLVASGESPAGQEHAVKRLDELSSGEAPPPAWLATHPYPALRLAALARDVGHHSDAARKLPLGEDAYREQVLARLSPLPPPRNHREPLSAETPPAEAQPGEAPPPDLPPPTTPPEPGPREIPATPPAPAGPATPATPEP